MKAATDEKRLWGIHTLDERLFLRGHLIAIGWPQMGNLSKLEPTREAFKEKYIAAYPGAKKGNVANGVGMLFRFCHEVEIGDYVVFPSRSDRRVHIGIVKGGYVYDEFQIEYVQQRKVKWLKSLPRTVFSQGALYEIGAAMSFFAVKNFAGEFLAALDRDFYKESLADSPEDESVGATAMDIMEATRDFILKELSRQFKDHGFEEFVADLLQAMGYRTTLSPPRGVDSGVDITAYKDELPPRILVQVKSQDSDIKETAIQSLKGAMKEGDYGLFVTLSNYTKNAQQYLSSTPIIKGINGVDLVELVLQYYDELSEQHRKMIPLRLVYIPVPKEDAD